jgi:RNA polymerase sigma factor (sigma-70 family)
MSAAMPRALPPPEHHVNVSPGALARDGQWGSSRSARRGTDVTQGDFHDQLAQHRPSLERAAMRLCHGNRADAEDHVQATFEKAWKARGQFVAGGNLGGWLFRILVNGHRDAIRRKVSFVPLPEDLPHATAQAEEVSALLALPAEAVTAALHELSPKLRAPLELHLQG